MSRLLQATLTPTSSVQVQPYPMVTPVNAPSETPFPIPKLILTQAGGTQIAYITSVNLTMTAMPSATLTPTFPVGALPCEASALQISARTEGFPTYLALFVEISNNSRSTCYLQGPPAIILVDHAGKPLDVEYYSVCYDCKKFIPLLTTRPRATQTAVLQELLYGKIGVGSNEHIGVEMDWENWCKPFPEGGVYVRLTLPDGLGVVDGPTDAYATSPCFFPNNRSQIGIGHYYHR